MVFKAGVKVKPYKAKYYERNVWLGNYGSV